MTTKQQKQSAVNSFGVWQNLCGIFEERAEGLQARAETEDCAHVACDAHRALSVARSARQEAREILEGYGLR